MKRFTALVLAFCTLTAFAACTDNTAADTTGQPAGSTAAQTTQAPQTGIAVCFNTGSGEPTVVYTAEDGTVNFPQTPEKDGFSFDGWYTEANGAGELILTGARVSAEAEYHAKWSEYVDMTKRNHILVGGYNGITEEFSCEEDFKLLAESGIDCIYMTYFHGAEDKKKYKSDECVKWMEQYGIKCWYNDFELNGLLKSKCSVEKVLEMTAPYRDSSSFIGIFLWDEPAAGNFAEIKVAVDTYHAALPDCDMHVNLLPNYAPTSVFVNKSFTEYVNTFAATVDIGQISQDTYPISTSSSKSEKKNLYSKYYEGLYGTAAAARDYGKDHWIYIWTMNDTVTNEHHYTITMNELRFEAFNALAFGACGITFFCYATPPSYIRSDSYGFVDASEKSPSYDLCTQLVKEIKALSEVYPKYLWQGYSGFICDDKSGKYLKKSDGFTEDYTAYIDEIKASQTLTIGLFDEANGPGYAVMLANQHDLNDPQPQQVSVRIDKAATLTAYIGTEKIALERGADGFFTFTLEPGQGAFLIVDLY